MVGIRSSGPATSMRSNGAAKQRRRGKPHHAYGKRVPLLVQAFEEQRQQQQQQPDGSDADAAAEDASEEGVEGAAMSDVEPEAIAADGSSMRAQMEAMQRLVREQAQQLQQLRALPQPLPSRHCSSRHTSAATH